METIPHRMLRNSSAEVLRRVAAGESLAVSNHGEVIGMLVPAREDPLDAARARGETRPARRQPRFSDVPRVGGMTTREILSDLRGDR